MKTRNSVDSWSRGNLEQAVKVMISIAGCSVALILFAYFLRFGPPSVWLVGTETPEQIVNAKAAWGQLGDFVGGSLNPLISALTLVGLVFTILLQHESMIRTQEDSNKNIASLREQSELSLYSARLQSLAAALEVITEMHLQAFELSHPSANDLLQKKDRLANEILDLNEQLRNRPA
jgi:hypothetical protein